MPLSLQSSIGKQFRKSPGLQRKIISSSVRLYEYELVGFVKTSAVEVSAALAASPFSIIPAGTLIDRDAVGGAALWPGYPPQWTSPIARCYREIMSDSGSDDLVPLVSTSGDLAWPGFYSTGHAPHPAATNLPPQRNLYPLLRFNYTYYEPFPIVPESQPVTKQAGYIGPDIVSETIEEGFIPGRIPTYNIPSFAEARRCSFYIEHERFFGAGQTERFPAHTGRLCTGFKGRFKPYFVKAGFFIKLTIVPRADYNAAQLHPCLWQYEISQATVLSTFTTSVGQWVEVPLPTISSGSCFLVVAILNETQSQWSTRTGIPIS